MLDSSEHDQDDLDLCATLISTISSFQKASVSNDVYSWLPRAILLQVINECIESHNQLWKIEERHEMIAKSLRVLSYAYNSSKISAELKKWTMDTDLIAVLEKVIEFDKASPVKSNK